MPHLKFRLTLLIPVAAVACGTPFGLGSDSRLPLEAISAPATLAAQTPLRIEVRYYIGACVHVTAVQRSVQGRLISLQVRGQQDPMPPGTGCPDVVYLRDTVVVVVNPPGGAVTVRGLQPSGPPTEVVVQVAR